MGVMGTHYPASPSPSPLLWAAASPLAMNLRVIRYAIRNNIITA